MQMLSVILSSALLLISPAPTQQSINKPPEVLNPNTPDGLVTICQRNILEVGKYNNPNWLDKVSRTWSVTDRSWLKRSCAMYQRGFMGGVKASAIVLESLSQDK